MIYQDLLKHKNKIHPMSKYFYDLSITKMAKYLGITVQHLTQVLTGGKKCSFEINYKLRKLSEIIEIEREEYWEDYEEITDCD